MQDEELTKTTFVTAVMFDDLNEMIKLREAGCPFGTASFAMAARLGGKDGLEKMRWLRSQGCSWDAETFTNAVRAASKDDDLENLEYLALIDCPWDTSTFSEAISGGNMKVIKWLSNPTSTGNFGRVYKRDPCPMDDQTKDMVREMIGILSQIVGDYVLKDSCVDH